MFQELIEAAVSAKLNGEAILQKFCANADVACVVAGFTKEQTFVFLFETNATAKTIHTFFRHKECKVA